MIPAGEFCGALLERGYAMFTGVPCSYFKDAIDHIEGRTDVVHLMAPNEGAAMAIASGAWLAGRRCVLLIQSSGLGNLVNPLTSLLLPYRIPGLAFVSGRAYPDGVGDEPQHRIMGERARDLLASIGAYRVDMPAELPAFAAMLDDLETVMAAGRTVVVMVPKGTITSSGGRSPRPSPYPMRRQEAIDVLAAQLRESDAVISTTGMISRELFGSRDRPGNFYMQGSMGHARSIALGVALSQPDRRVVVLDGDGAALMHLGSLSTVGHYAPANLLDVVLDNEAHGTTGYQETTSSTTRLDLVAQACNYGSVRRCTTPAELAAAVASGLSEEGPSFILAKVNREEAGHPPRVTARYTPDATAIRVQNFLTVATGAPYAGARP